MFHRAKVWCSIGAMFQIAACSAPNSHAAATLNATSITVDTGAWETAYAGVVNTDRAQDLIRSMGESGADLRLIAARSTADKMVIGDQTFSGLRQQRTAAAATGTSSSLNDYWKTIAFEPQTVISKTEFRAALKTVAGLFPGHGNGAAQLTGTADAATVKANAQAIAKVFVFGIVALSVRSANDAALQLNDTLPAGTTVVQQVSDANMYREISAGQDTVGPIGADFINVMNDARANNDSLYAYNSARPNTLENVGLGSSTPQISVSGSSNVQICTNGNCDQANGAGGINYPNSGTSTARH